MPKAKMIFYRFKFSLNKILNLPVIVVFGLQGVSLAKDNIEMVNASPKEGPTTGEFYFEGKLKFKSLNCKKMADVADVLF